MKMFCMTALCVVILLFSCQQLIIGYQDFMITYDGNGHTGGVVPADNTKHVLGSAVTILGPGSMTKSGNTFESWNTSRNGSGIRYVAGSTLAMPGNNLILYAQWQTKASMLSDDFESYALNTWPGLWSPDANAVSDTSRNRIESDPQEPDNKVLKLYGVPGQFWGALGYRAMNIPDEFTLDFRVRNGSDSIPSSGHQDRGEIHLRNGTNWLNYSRLLLRFDKSGNAYRSDNSLIRQYSLSNWHSVRIHYLRTGSTLKISYWINGLNEGSVTLTIANTAQEDSLNQLGLSAQAGTSYFDSINIDEGAPANLNASKVKISGNAMWNDLAYFSWQNRRHVYEPDSLNAVIDTWKFDDNKNKDPSDDINRILWNNQTDVANGIWFGIHSVLSAQESGWQAMAFINSTGNGVLEFKKTKGSSNAVARYSLKPDSGKLYGQLTFKTASSGTLSWGINIISGVWVSNGLGELSLYDKAHLNGNVITARTTSSNGDFELGKDYLRSENVISGTAAIISTTRSWVSAFKLTDSSSPVNLQAHVRMRSEYGGWGFDRCALIVKPLISGQSITIEGTFDSST